MHSRKRWAGDEPFGSKWSSGLRESPPKLPAHGKWWKCLTDLPSRNQKWGGQGVRFGILPGRELDYVHVKTLEEIRQEKELKKRRAQGIPSTDTRPTVSTLKVRDPSCSINQAKTPSHLPRPCSLKTHQHMDAKNKERAISVLNKYLKDGIYENIPQVSKITDLRSRLSLGVKFVADTTDRNHCGQVRETYVQNMRRREPIDGKTFSKGSRAWSGGYLKLQTASRTHLGVGKPDEDQYAGKAQEADMDEDDACSTSDVSDEEDTDESSDDASDGEVQIRNVEQEIGRDSEDDETSDGSSEDELDSSESELRESDDEVCNAHRADSEIQTGASNEQTAHSESEENGEVDEDLGRDENINDLISEEEFESLESDHELCCTEAIELERVTGRGDGLVEVTSRQDKRQVEEGSEDRVFTADVHEESSDLCDSVSNDEVCGASADEVAPDFEPEEKQIKDLQGKESTDENEDTEVDGEFSVENTDGEPNCCLEDKSLFSRKIAAVDDMPLDKENQDEQIQNLHGQESRRDKEDIEDGGKFFVGDSDGEPNCSVENTSEEDSSFSGTFVDEVQPDKENEGEQMEDIQGRESGEGSEDGGKRPVGDSDRELNGCEEDPSEKEQSFSGLSAAVDEMQFDKENKNEQMEDFQEQERRQDKEDIEDGGNLLVEDSDRKSSSHGENQSEEEPSFPGTSTAVDGVLLDKENQESGEDSEDVEDGGKLPVEDYDGEPSCCKENHSEEEPSFSRIAVDEMQQNKENKYDQLEVDIYGDKQDNESLFSVIDHELFIHEEYDTNVLCEADEQLEKERELAGIINREAMEERRREEREALVTVIIEVFDKDDGHKMDTNLPANRTSRPCLDFETMEQSEGGPTDDKGITKIGKEAGNILDDDILSDEGSSEKPKLPQARKTDSRPRGDTVVDVTKERDCEDENTTTGSKDEEARQIEEISDGALLICEAILPQEDNWENVVSEFDGGKETRDQLKEKNQEHFEEDEKRVPMGSDSIVGQGYDEPSHDNLERYERQLVCIIDKVKSAEMDLGKKGRPIKDPHWEKDDVQHDKDEEAVKGGTEDGSSYEQKAQKDIHLCNDGDGQIKTDGTPEDGQKKDENIWEDGEVRDDYAELGYEDVTEEGTAFDKDCLQEVEQGSVVEDHEDISIAADDVANNKQGSTEEQEEEVPDSEIMETDEDISENDTSSSGVCDKEIVEETILRGWEENDREVKGDKLDEGRTSEDEELPEDDMKEMDKDDRDRRTEMKNKSKEGKKNEAKKDAQNVQAVTSEVNPVGQDIGTHMDCQIGLETNKKSLDSQAEVINMDMCCQHQELDGYSITKEIMVDDTKKHTDDSAATDEPSVNHRQTRVGRNKRRLVHQGVGKGQEVADKEVACDDRGSLEEDAVNISEKQVMEDDVVGKRKVGRPRTRPQTQKRGTTLSRIKRVTTLGRSVVMSSLRMEGADAVVKRKRGRPHELRETSMETNRQNLHPGVVIQDYGVTEEKPEAVHPKQPKVTRRKARQRMMSSDGSSKELGQGDAIQLILEQGEVLTSGSRPSPVVEVDVRLGNDRESHSVVSPVSKKRMTRASLKPRCCRRLRDRDDVMVRRRRGRPCSRPVGIEKDETLRATFRASTEEGSLSPVDPKKLTASSLPQAEGNTDKNAQPVQHQDDSQQESPTQKQRRRQLDNIFFDHKDDTTQECLIPCIVTTQSSCPPLPQTEGNTEEGKEVQPIIQGRAPGNESTECSQGLDTSRAVKTRGRKPLTPNMPAFLGPTIGDEAKTVNDAKMQVTLSKTLEPKAMLSCVSGDDTAKPSGNRRRKAKIREASSDLSSGQSEDQSDKDNTSKSTSRSISAALTSPFRTRLRKRSQLQGLPTPEVEAETSVHTAQMQQMSASQSQPKADSPSNETVIYQESFKNAIIQEMASFYPIINLTPLHVPEAYLIADASRRVSANECGIIERGTSSTWLKGSFMPETEDEVNSENTEAQPPEVVSCTSAAKLDSTTNKHQKWLDAIVGVDCSLSTGADGYCKVDSEIHLRLPENLSKEMCTEENPIARKRKLTAGSTQQSESSRQESRPVRGRAKGAMNLGVLPENPPPKDPRPAQIEDNGIVNPSAQSAPSAISSQILPSTCDAAGKKMRTVGRWRKKLQDLVSSEPSSKQAEEKCYEENLKISSESIPEIDPEPNVRKARTTRKWRTRPSEANTRYPLLKQTEADGSKTKDTGIKLPAPDPVQSNPPKRRIKLKRGIKPPEVAKDDDGTTHPVPISNLNTSQSERTKLGSSDDTVKRGECSVTPEKDPAKISVTNETFMQQIPRMDVSESSLNIFDLIMKRQVQVSLPIQAEVNVTGTETEAKLIPLENALQSERSKTAKEIISHHSSTSSKPSTQSDENDCEKSAKFQVQAEKNTEQADSNHYDAIGTKLRTTKQRGKMSQQINSFGSLSTQSEIKESDRDIEVPQKAPENAVQSTQSRCVDIGKKRGRKAKKNRMTPPEIVFFGALNKLHSDPSLCEAIFNKSRKRKRIATQRFAYSDSSTQSEGIDSGKSKEVHQEASENASKSAQRNAKRRRKQPSELDSSEPSWTQFEGDDNNQSVEVHHQVCNDASITNPGRCDAIVQEAQAVITRSRNIARDNLSDPTKQSGENYSGKDFDVQNEAITKHSAPTRNKSRIEERQAGWKRRETISQEAFLSSEAGEDHTEKDSKVHKLPPRDTSKSVHKQCDLVLKKPRGLRKRRRKPISKETVSTDYSSSTQDKGEENTNCDAVVDESRSAVVFRSNTPKRISPEAGVFNGDAQSQENTILEESISKDEINFLHLMRVQESKESSVHGHEGDTDEDEVCETLPKVKRRKTNDGGQNNAISKLKRKPFKKRFSTSPPEKPRMCSEGDRVAGPSGDAQVSKLSSYEDGKEKGLKSSSDACGDAATTGSTVPHVDGSEQYIWSRILGKVSLAEILTNQPTVQLSRLKFRETIPLDAIASKKFSSPSKRRVKHAWTRRRKVMSIATIARRMTKGLEAIQETWNRLGFQIPSELTSATMDRTMDGCHRSTLPKRSLDGERRSVSEGRIKYSSGTPNSAPPIEIVEAPEVAHTVEVVSTDDLPVTPRYEGCFVPRALQGSGKSNIRPSTKLSSCGLEVNTSTADSATAMDIDSELENQVSILLSEYESMEVASSTVEMSSSEDICGSDTFFIASPSVRVVVTPVDMMPSFSSRQSTLDMLRTLPRIPVTGGEARARCTPIFTGCSDDVVSSRSMWRASRSTDTTSDDDRLDSKSQGNAFMEGSNGSFLLNQEQKRNGPSPPSSQEPFVDWQTFSLSTEQHVGGQTHLLSPEQVDGQASSLQQTGGQSGLFSQEEMIRGHNDIQTPLLSPEQLGDGQLPLLSPEPQVGGQIPLLNQEQQVDGQAPLLSPEQQVGGQTPLLSPEQQVGGQTPLLSPEQQVDGQSPMLSPEQQVGGQTPLLSPEKQVDGPSLLLSPEQHVGRQNPLLSPEQQVDGQTSLLSPEQQVGGQTPLLSPKQQVCSQTPLLSPEQHVGGQTPSLSPEQQVGRQTPLLRTEQQVGGQTPLLSPEQQVGGQTPLLSPDQQVGSQTPLLIPEQLNGCQDHVLSPAQQAEVQVPLLNPTQQVDGRSPFLNPEQRISGQDLLMNQEQVETAKQALSNALDKESNRLAPSRLESKSEEILPVKNCASVPASCETASKGSTPPSSQTALSMPDLGREVLQQYHASSPPFQQISESPRPVDPAAANYEEDPQDLSIGLGDIILSPLVDSFEFPEEDCLSLLCDSPGFLDDFGDELLEIDKQMGQSEKRQAGGYSSRHANSRQGTNNADSDSVRPINGNASLQTVDWSEVSQYQPINSLTGGDCSISSAGRVNRNIEGKILGINQPQAAPWTGLAMANQVIPKGYCFEYVRTGHCRRQRCMFRHALLEAPKSCQGDNNGQQANKPPSTGSRIMGQVMMSNHPSYIGTQQSNIHTPSPYPSPPPPPPPPPPPASHYPQHPVSEFQPHTQLYEGSAVPHSALMHPSTLSHYPHPQAPPQFYNPQYRGVSQNLLTSKNAVDFILDLSRWGHVSKAWQEFQRTGLPRASSLPLMVQILHGCCGQNVRDPAKWSVAYCILEEISHIPQYDCTAQCMLLIKHLLQDGQTGDPATFHLMAMNVFNNLLPMKPNMTDMNMALINRMGRMLLELNHIHPLCDLVMGIIKRKAFNCLPSPDIINGIKTSLQKENDLNTLQTLVTALNETQNVQETSTMEIDFENNNSTVDPARKLMDSDSKKCPSEVFEASFSIQQCTMWKDTRDTLLDLCQRRPDVARAKPVIQELMKKLVEPADMAGSKFNNFVTVFSRHFKDVNLVRVLSRLGINCLAMCCSTHQWQQAFYILDCLSTNHFPYLQELGSDILVPHPKLKLFNWDVSEVWVALVSQVCLEVREPKYATQLLADPNINVSIDEEDEGSHNPLFHLSCKKLEQLVRLCVDKSAFSQSLVPLKHLHKQNHYERYTSLFNQVLFASLDSRNKAYFSIYQEMQTERAMTLEKRNYRLLISVLWNTGTDYKQQYARQLHTRGFNNGIYIKFKKDQKYHEACLLFDLTAGEVNLTMESFLTDAHTLEIVAKHKQRSTCTVKLSFINNDRVLAPNSAGPRNILRLVDSYLEESTPPIKWKNSSLRAASEDVYHQSYLLDLDSVGKWLEKQGM